MGTFDQGRDVLLVQRNASHFTKTPALTPQEVCCVRNMRFSSVMSPDFTVSVNNMYRADQFDLLNYIYKSIPVTQQKQYVYEKLLERNMETSDFKINFKHRDSTSIGLSYVANAQKLKAQYGNDILITEGPLWIPQFEEPKKRQLPLQIDYPVYKIDTLGYDVKDIQGELTVPDNVSISGKYGEYFCQISHTKEQVLVIKHFLLYPGRYPLDEYDKFYQFISQVKKANDKKYLIIHTN